MPANRKGGSGSGACLFSLETPALHHLCATHRTLTGASSLGAMMGRLDQQSEAGGLLSLTAVSPPINAQGSGPPREGSRVGSPWMDAADRGHRTSGRELA